MTTPTTRLALPLALLMTCIAGDALAGDVWVVDDLGGIGVDFTSIQGAINAAADGDVVLVKSGFYESFAIDGKSLTIVADDGFLPAVNYTTEVSNLAANQRVVLRGLQLGPTSLALDIRNCAGPVWVSDCRVEAHNTFATGFPDALHVTNCASVVLDGCFVAAPNEPFGWNGCVATNSDLTLWATEMRGGFPDFPSTQGGAGLDQTGGSLFAMGCTFVGGIGGWGGDWGEAQCFPGGTGGTGLHMTDVVATLRDTSSAGGPGGTSFGTPCPDGATGAAMEALGLTSVTVIDRASRAADLPRVLRGATVANLELEGAAGDLAFVFLGVGVAPFEAFDLSGVVVPLAPWTLLASAVVGSNGTASIPLNVPVLPSQIEAIVATGQAVFYSAQDGPVLGSPFVSVVLGQGF